MTKSVFKPLLNHLQGTGFYKVLEKWEGFVADAVKNTDKASDPSDTDEGNDVDITNYYDTVQLMEEMEKRQYEEEKEEEYICPPTQPSTVLCDVNTVGDVTRASDVNRDSCQ
ncbi:hypothetical protein PPTG_19682 [Phytophthora nicotianae INRA-310]|uniref:Uncharacterized protein n=1 Tax=Phytophthora nicotianae (strain INRA-310) TaxID=761204 RepID=W2PE67_PHYN3|nr:hypothetical protein PPTG_19682 [Phytophthora nicotianae INRA-310]ETM98279.1 hypothetical protein PPTG_19682 [Phytophthora nicotianae INRA-310]